MKKYILLPLFFAFLASCEQKVANNISDDSDLGVSIPKIVSDTIPIWIYNYKIDAVSRNPSIGNKEFSVDELIELLNISSPNVQLQKIQVSNDTLYVGIEESRFLTQRMGTTGAQSYLSIATYTLTEPERISHVNFDFEIGDHAMPGIYGRNDFSKDEM